MVERFGKPGKNRLKSSPIETTLFDLIGAIQEVISPEEENRKKKRLTQAFPGDRGGKIHSLIFKEQLREVGDEV